MKWLLIASLISSVCNVIQSANILAIIPSPYFSHQVTYRPLWRELAKRGHNITLITTDLMERNENITQIDYSKTYKIYEKYQLNKLLIEGSTIQLLLKLVEGLDEVFGYQLTHPDLISLIRNKAEIDLIILENIVPGISVLSTHFKCPFIGLTSMDALSVVHGSLGNAEHPAIYPFPGLGFVNELSFTERLISTTAAGAIYILCHAVFIPLMNRYARKHIGLEWPDTFDAVRNSSLMFINANPIFFPSRPLTPTTINLGGGLHLTEPQKLPKDLQDYLDQSKSGCIYFSFGSTVNSNYLTPEVIEIFRKTFEDLAPLRVLWKFENESLANKPKNMEIRTWFPQQDILRHPNVKVFITQGGLQSMEEAIDSSVPMLGMPFYGDQINNVKKMVIKEFGVQLDVKTMDRETLKSSILELINNPKYKKNIERLSAITKDQPMRGLEKAVWWTEYVLRHGGTEHLRSPSADIPLYQYFFLDIIAFLIVALIFIILLFYYSFKLLRYVFRKLFKSKNKEKVN